MLKFADWYKPKTVNPRIVDPTTAPATPKDKKVKRTRSANASLDRRRFSFGGLVMRCDPALLPEEKGGFKGYEELDEPSL